MVSSTAIGFPLTKQSLKSSPKKLLTTTSAVMIWQDFTHGKGECSMAFCLS